MVIVLSLDSSLVNFFFLPWSIDYLILKVKSILFFFFCYVLKGKRPFLYLNIYILTEIAYFEGVNLNSKKKKLDTWSQSFLMVLFSKVVNKSVDSLKKKKKELFESRLCQIQTIFVFWDLY